MPEEVLIIFAERIVGGRETIHPIRIDECTHEDIMLNVFVLLFSVRVVLERVRPARNHASKSESISVISDLDALFSDVDRLPVRSVLRR